MAFAVEEINRSPSLLPNLTLGYVLYDTCFTLDVSFRAALSLISGREKRVRMNESCDGSPPVLGIVGDPSSSNSISMSSVLGLYRVPLVSCQVPEPPVFTITFYFRSCRADHAVSH